MKCAPGLPVRKFSGYSEREIDICEERTPDAGRLTADGNRRGTAKLEWPPGRIVKLV